MSNHDIPCRGCGEDQRLLGLSHEANCLASKLDSSEKIVDAYESAMVALRETIGVDGYAEHEHVIDTIRRIRGRENTLDVRGQELETRLEVVSKEVEAVEALLEKATNDVSAWNSRASGAESRLHSLVSQAFESVTLGELRDWIINNVEPDRRPVAVEKQCADPYHGLKGRCPTCGKYKDQILSE